MFEEYKQCQLCPRKCGADRAAGRIGFCGETAHLHIASIGAHFGEEPPLTGKYGSGTVFFTGCQTGCFFCQNYQLSTEHIGKFCTEDDVFFALKQLIDNENVHNVNFVTPEPWWPHILEICRKLRAAGYDIPFVWNSSGYSRPELLREQAKIIDIFLQDFKFADSSLSELCMGRRDYPEVALSGLKVLADQVGFLRPFDTTGEITATRGMMVRHLVLPGYVENSVKVLQMLYAAFGDGLPIAVMRQYKPMPECFRRNLLTRSVSEEEYQIVCDEILRLGFRHVFVQTDELNEDFIPDFTKENPFVGNIKRKKA